jgi:transglutaminase-like putative cysteine protease
MTATATASGRRPATGEDEGSGSGPGSGRHRFKAPSATSAHDAIATVALTALTLAGVFSLNRVFVGRSFAGPVVVVAIGAHGVAWICRRQGWPPLVTALVSLLTLILLVSWTVLPGSTTFGLPLIGTWHAATHAIHQATLDFHRVATPAPVTQGFVLFAVSGVGLLALLADWAAFRMRATLEATVPTFAIFIFCAIFGNRSSRTPAVIVEVSALIAFVVIHQATVDQETSAWFANRTDGALKSAFTAGAVIGLASLFVALNLGYRLPGATSKAAIAVRSGDLGGAGTRSTESPLVKLQSKLEHPSPVPIFSVTSSQPEYWRLTALDTFNGTDWNALSTYNSAGSHLGEGATPTVGGQQVEQDFVIANLDQPWLPAAYRPVAISGIKGITYDAQSGSLISGTNTLAGVSYHVTSTVSSGPDEAARLSAAPAPDSSTLAHFLQLPTFSAEVNSLDRQVTAGKTTEYDKALSIQNYLRTFSYDVTYDYSGSNPLDHFLFDAKKGFCQQFATAFAVLARLGGLPTRLAVGWTPGDQVSPGVYQVSDVQWHTWPEVYFSGIGWVPFEPTPGRGIPGAVNYTGVAPAQASALLAPNNGAVTTVPGASTPVTRPNGETATTAPRPHAAVGGRHHRVWWISVLVWLGSAISVVALLAGANVALRWFVGVATRDRVVNQAAELESEGRSAPKDRFAQFRKDWSADGLSGAGAFGRRLKAIVLLGWLRPFLPWRARPAPLQPEVVTRAEVLLSWSEVLDLLAWWGVRRRPSETYRELAHRAAIELRLPLSLEPNAVHALLEVADAATKAEFGAGSMSQLEAEAGAANLAVVRRTLIGSATNTQRLRLAIDPRLSVKVR